MIGKNNSHSISLKIKVILPKSVEKAKHNIFMENYNYTIVDFRDNKVLEFLLPKGSWRILQNMNETWRVQTNRVKNTNFFLNIIYWEVGRMQTDD